MRIGFKKNTNDLKEVIKYYLNYFKTKCSEDCIGCPEYVRKYDICKTKDGICSKKPIKSFFVLFFHKIKDKYKYKKPPIYAPYRHEKFIKEDVKPRVEAFLKLRKLHPKIANHVYGIDACSQEIGCRPEVFAPSFRKIRKTTPSEEISLLKEKDEQLRFIHITYHAGEDFLDIADGLRAIDEAIRFNEMQHADRIGHALALGINPVDHYKSKGGKIFLPRHDLLDNAMWVIVTLRHCQQFIPDVFNELEQVFREQYIYIYGANLPSTEQFNGANLPSIEQFYDAWLLRGDAPYHYKKIRDNNDFNKYLQGLSIMNPNKYNCDFQSDKQVKNIRENNFHARELYYNYHYNHDVRKKGDETIEWKITPRYAHAIKLLQDCMQQYIADHGIGIECNPSSNYLIGTFKDYSKHPMFRFNNDGLGDETDNAMMQISINTDDQGVFETDLENEYALIACALENMTDDHGKKIYKQNNIYKYIDNVRQMGVDQSFMLIERNTGGQNGY